MEVIVNSNSYSKVAIAKLDNRLIIFTKMEVIYTARLDRATRVITTIKEVEECPSNPNNYLLCRLKDNSLVLWPRMLLRPKPTSTRSIILCFLMTKNIN